MRLIAINFCIALIITHCLPTEKVSLFVWQVVTLLLDVLPSEDKQAAKVTR